MASGRSIRLACAGVALLASAIGTVAHAQATRLPTSTILSQDLYALRDASDPRISPDGKTALFAVRCRDRPGTPYTRLFIADLRGGGIGPWGAPDGVEGASARWSPDGRWVAFLAAGKLMVTAADGTGARILAAVDDTNDPLPIVGERFSWSPDGRRIVFVSAVPGSRPAMEADPIVVDRYWYRPQRGWPTRFNDGKLLHLFVVETATGKVEQLTSGEKDEHSVDWSPDGRTILFASNTDPDKDFTFNLDLFAMDIASRRIRRLTSTKGIEYAARWSPDGRAIAFAGLGRSVTSSESNMEMPHVWVMDVASGARREVGATIDDAQGPPRWSADGRWLYTTVQSRGHIHLHRLPASGGPSQRIALPAALSGSVAAFDVDRSGAVLAAVATPADLPELYLLDSAAAAPAQALTSLNGGVLAGKQIARVEAFSFASHDGQQIEAFLTLPPRFRPDHRHSVPMIVEVHGGPHAQQGAAYVHKSQVFAAHYWAVLAVNYRGSTGYGQVFANMIARDQDGAEAMDVLAGVDAALARYPALDPDRLGIEGASYGGQLTNWLITQTPRFKAAIPWAGISNLVSHNYMSVYHDYLQQEYFAKPHQAGVSDMLWGRSPLRFVQKVTTPVLLSHGDNDLLVNPAEDEQYFIALRDVGVETMMLRYPREGHGMSETQHLVDFADRSVGWYETHFTPMLAKNAERAR